MSEARRRGGRCGFTIIELLVVATVIAILLAILLPSLRRARERAHTAYCLANLREIGHGVVLYALENDGFATPRMIGSDPGGVPPNYPLRADGTVHPAYWSDQILLGQYLANTNGDNMHPAFVEGQVSRRSPFVCPSDMTHPPTDGEVQTLSYGMPANFTSITAPNFYSRMWKLNNVQSPATEMDAVDSLSPLMSPGGWVEPYTFYGNTEPLLNGNWTDSDPNSYYNWARRHDNGANVLFLDGHAETIADLKAAYDRGQITVHRVE